MTPRSLQDFVTRSQDTDVVIQHPIGGTPPKRSPEDELVDVRATYGIRPHFPDAREGMEKNRKLHFRTAFQGMPISVENQRGSYRHWHDPLTGRDGRTRMPCVPVGTPVLTTDLRWVPVEKLSVGDGVWGFTEEKASVHGRVWARGEVTSTSTRPEVTVTLNLASGRALTSTLEHLWLVRRPSIGLTTVWAKASHIRPGWLLPRYLEPWERLTTYDAGWLAAMFDAEGSFNSTHSNLTYAQKPGPTLDKFLLVLSEMGYTYKATPDPKNGVVHVVVAGIMQDKIALLGAIGADRLISNFKPGKALLGHEWDEVVSVADGGVRDIVVLSTSTRTFFADGYGAHNCHYGYLRMTEGADGDHVDCFVNLDNPDAPHAYVVRQVHPETGAYDEDKVMLGFVSEAAAKAAYLAAYDDPRFFGSIHEVPMGEFRSGAKLADGRPIAVKKFDDGAPYLWTSAGVGTWRKDDEGGHWTWVAGPVDDYASGDVKKVFNPDQPRDDHGRWTPEGMASHGFTQEAFAAIRNTPGAKLNFEGGLELDVSRYQEPEQAGERSLRTGVFFLPELKSPYRGYYSGKKVLPGIGGGTAQPYGGTQRVEGRITLHAPLVIKAGTGGTGIVRAYDKIEGKGAYEKMRTEVLGLSNVRSTDPPKNDMSFRDLREAHLREILEKYGGTPDLAPEILTHSTKGNLFAYAVQEHIAAHALRKAGYDSVLSYSKSGGAPRLSEVFDLTQTHYPDSGWMVKAAVADSVSSGDPDVPWFVKDFYGYAQGARTDVGEPRSLTNFLRPTHKDAFTTSETAGIIAPEQGVFRKPRRSRSLNEFLTVDKSNDCHVDSGPKGGEFCSDGMSPALAELTEVHPPPPVGSLGTVFPEEARAQLAVHFADLGKLTAEDLQGLKAGGVRFVVSGHEGMGEMKSDLKGKHPRGWGNSTWNNVAAAYVVADRKVYAGYGLGSSASIALHETGHAVFHALTPDEKNNLDKIWLKTVARQPSIQPYYRQRGISGMTGGHIGTNETFAECFAELRSGRQSPSSASHSSLSDPDGGGRQAWAEYKSVVAAALTAWNGRAAKAKVVV